MAAQIPTATRFQSGAIIPRANLCPRLLRWKDDFRLLWVGVSPAHLTIATGQRVTFTNSDSVEHQMYDDPHPSHDGNCPELNQIGSLRAGQSKESGNFVTAKTCTYHEHLRPTSNTLKGRIVIR